MPNHVINRLRFKNLKEEDKRFILDTICTPVEKKSSMTVTELAIDFDKIIPQPRLKEDCPEDCLVNKDSHIMEDEDRPWFDWYKWNNRYWGTKWNAYECYIHTGKTYLEFEFQTAWSLAYPVIRKLALLGYNIDIKWADEDLGVNCGRMEFEKETGMWHEMEPLHPRKFAERLWGGE